MRRIVVASTGYLREHGEPSTPEAVAAHATIQFGAVPDWRFVEDGSRTAHHGHAPFCHQQRRCGDPVCRAGRGTDAGDGVSGGRFDQGRPAQDRTGAFEQPALPIHIVYPTSRLLSAKVRAFIDLVVETSDWHFG